MESLSQTLTHNLSLSSSENKRDVLYYEKNAEKALRNINSIYDEIMKPNEYDTEDLELPCPYNEENLSHSYAMQTHCLRSCCNSVKELCVKCDRLISQCTSCNQCKCCTADKNLKKIPCKERSYPGNSSDLQHRELKCTIPKPFSFCAKIEEYQKAKEYKISKLKQDREKKIETELKVRVNFKPVPKSTHLPLFCEMVQKNEQRKVKRKEECQKRLNSTKPFNLHSSSKNSEKAKSTPDLSSEDVHFKAKPTPKYILSNKISDKLRNKEEIRKLLIGERAKQTIENSSLPFSQKTVPSARSCVDLYSLKKMPNKKSKPKNIAEITKRLYVKKCCETMESWNRKVMQVNTDKDKLNQEMYNSLNEYMSYNIKEMTKKEELPFMYFPVRMSNTSLLREKLIR